MISLDIFKKIFHNRNITDRLEAWLTFFCEDKPEYIERLITKYPRFRELYEEVYAICQNIGKVMEMFSRELSEPDRNTMQYMIDEMQEELEARDCRTITRWCPVLG